jgi:hypothetical protein
LADDPRQMEIPSGQRSLSATSAVFGNSWRR